MPREAVDRVLGYRLNAFVIACMMALASMMALAAVTGVRGWSLPFMPGSLFSDAVTAHLPAAQFFNDSISEEGEWPLWRPTTMAGTPFAANPLNKTTYPPQWFAAVMSPGTFLLAMIFAHGAIASVGMWVFLRRLQLPAAAALFGAGMYGLSPRWVAHLGMGHLDLWYAFAWLPWLLWAVHILMTAPHTTLRQVVGVGLLAGLLVLADVRAALFGLLLAAAFGVRLALIDRRPASLMRGIPVLVIVAGLVIGLVVPLAGWMPYLTRAGLTATEAGASSVDLLAGGVGLVLPAHLGSAEGMTYLGLPVLLLAIVGLIRDRRARWWGIVALVAAWYALGPAGGLWTVITSIVPGLTWFRVPGRAWLIVALIAPMLAAYGLAALMNIEKVGHRSRWLAGLLMAVFICAGLGVIALNTPTLPDSMGTSTLIGGAGGCLLIVLSLYRPAVRVFIVGLAALALADVLLTAHMRVEWRTAVEWSEPYLPLAVRLADMGADRVYSPTYSLPQQVAEYEYLRLFGGIDPFQIAGVSAAITQAAGLSGVEGYSIAQPPLIGMMGEAVSTANRDSQPDAALLAAWRVSHVVAAYPITHPDLRLIDRIDGEYVYANTLYNPAAPTDPISGWPSAFPGLPSPVTVTQLHDLTLWTTTLGALVFIGCGLIVLIDVWLRGGR